ncbi:peptide chain release factor N(5)-glutamine methyltransferase [Subsaximicrobium wynnwilliamsii]|uniref:Release factor glutamine methyltransferase n=1 Tax=Subsaximicrobium wynnwilliamsii TaxID=291179 RepID=A0A5C6ZQP7_9FLAO|nr:peptide chain release factor N(5)-glutamine methyltransferase [Subsaximicrobium wynnwilliamsii]TXD85170.1 peptide chain release factor N(5)-glutamine methyltransferase [Subsaximicrobium wynnwilliamsii]TXD91213.1 peptide chain release factor N(5)-glutamine methyltransferase [Subsaximicrobium wynnwilliamsii]TXE04607.1 peptide chain release factor N(5)-glutamine methyltransferase [Subsaximicrobium wynnwilliamsii]
MILKDILNIYHKELDLHYGKEEVDSFFNLLIEHYLKLKRITMLMNPGFVVTKTEEQPLFEALAALKLQKPIQHIIGETEFYGLPFKVNRHTLIPRPETEELVAWIIEDYNANQDNAEALTILDIGTGSGCIAIALAKQLSASSVYAVDVSEEALKMAVENAKVNEVKIEFGNMDILEPDHRNLPAGRQGLEFLNLKFDIIVSNPPYVRQLEKELMQANVLDHEPHEALFVEDGNPLLFYRAICELAQAKLKPGGSLYFEINEYLGDEMVQLLKSFHFEDIELKSDIFGKPRMIKAVKND